MEEQHLAIDASGPHFTESASLLPDDICTLFTQAEVYIPPRTDKRLAVCPKASSGLKCPPGATGIVSSNMDDYGIWDAASTVQGDSTVDIVFANTSRTDIRLHPSAPIGNLQLIDPSEGKQLDETTLAEIFDNPDGEPEDPPRGAIQEPSTAELSFLDESINIQAPDPWASTYRESLYRYHDVISKGKFDLGWTDVVEHKIDLTHRRTLLGFGSASCNASNWRASFSGYSGSV